MEKQEKLDFIEHLKQIHYDFDKLRDEDGIIKDWKSVKEFLLKFKNPALDVNELKTILVISKSFKDVQIEGINELRKEIKEIFDRKMENL